MNKHELRISIRADGRVDRLLDGEFFSRSSTATTIASLLPRAERFLSGMPRDEAKQFRYQLGSVCFCTNLANELYRLGRAGAHVRLLLELESRDLSKLPWESALLSFSDEVPRYEPLSRLPIHLSIARVVPGLTRVRPTRGSATPTIGVIRGTSQNRVPLVSAIAEAIVGRPARKWSQDLTEGELLSSTSQQISKAERRPFDVLVYVGHAENDQLLTFPKGLIGSDRLPVARVYILAGCSLGKSISEDSIVTKLLDRPDTEAVVASPTVISVDEACALVSRALCFALDGQELGIAINRAVAHYDGLVSPMVLWGLPNAQISNKRASSWMTEAAQANTSREKAYGPGLSNALRRSMESSAITVVTGGEISGKPTTIVDEFLWQNIDDVVFAHIRRDGVRPKPVSEIVSEMMEDLTLEVFDKREYRHPFVDPDLLKVSGTVILDELSDLAHDDFKLILEWIVAVVQAGDSIGIRFVVVASDFERIAGGLPDGVTEEYSRESTSRRGQLVAPVSAEDLDTYLEDDNRFELAGARFQAKFDTAVRKIRDNVQLHEVFDLYGGLLGIWWSEYIPVGSIRLFSETGHVGKIHKLQQEAPNELLKRHHDSWITPERVVRNLLVSRAIDDGHVTLAKWAVITRDFYEQDVAVDSYICTYWLVHVSDACTVDVEEFVTPLQYRQMIDRCVARFQDGFWMRRVLRSSVLASSDPLELLVEIRKRLRSMGGQDELDPIVGRWASFLEQLGWGRELGLGPKELDQMADLCADNIGYWDGLGEAVSLPIGSIGTYHEYGDYIGLIVPEIGHVLMGRSIDGTGPSLASLDRPDASTIDLGVRISDQIGHSAGEGAGLPEAEWSMGRVYWDSKTGSILGEVSLADDSTDLIWVFELSNLESDPDEVDVTVFALSRQAELWFDDPVASVSAFEKGVDGDVFWPSARPRSPVFEAEAGWPCAVMKPDGGLSLIDLTRPAVPIVGPEVLTFGTFLSVSWATDRRAYVAVSSTGWITLVGLSGGSADAWLVLARWFVDQATTAAFGDDCVWVGTQNGELRQCMLNPSGIAVRAGSQWHQEAE